MMKKLLVLLLVFGITSIANAGVIDLQIASLNGVPITPVKEITIGESDWVDIDIIYTGVAGQHLGQLSLELTLTGLATMDMTDLTLPPGVWSTDATFSPGVTEIVAGKQYTLTYGEDTGTSGVVEPFPGIAIDHILVHCDSIEPLGNIVTLVITADVLYGGIGSAEFDPFGMIGMGLSYGPGVTITQIPEPMTIALLGLGGLFLLRRRK